jgi:hypothetical protein
LRIREGVRMQAWNRRRERRPKGLRMGEGRGRKQDEKDGNYGGEIERMRVEGRDEGLSG